MVFIASRSSALTVAIRVQKDVGAIQVCALTQVHSLEIIAKDRIRFRLSVATNAVRDLVEVQCRFSLTESYEIETTDLEIVVGLLDESPSANRIRTRHRPRER